MFSMKVLFSCALMLSLVSPAFPQPLPNQNPTNRVARVLIVTGMDYPGHLWRKTSPVLAEALGKDPRLKVFTVQDPWFLDSEAVPRYDVIVIHFENWEQPAPGQRARENLRNFIQGGKGVVLLHFGCGA